jgi:hypothetical protein
MSPRAWPDSDGACCSEWISVDQCVFEIVKPSTAVGIPQGAIVTALLCKGCVSIFR